LERIKKKKPHFGFSVFFKWGGKNFLGLSWGGGGGGGTKKNKKKLWRGFFFFFSPLFFFKGFFFWVGGEKIFFFGFFFSPGQNFLFGFFKKQKRPGGKNGEIKKKNKGGVFDFQKFR